MERDMDRGTLDAGDWLDRLSSDDRAALWQLLELGIAEADRGEFADAEMETLLAEGRARRAQTRNAA